MPREPKPESRAGSAVHMRFNSVSVTLKQKKKLLRKLEEIKMEKFYKKNVFDVM